jgi:hypothetical protein
MDNLRTSIHDSFAILNDKLSIHAKEYEIETSKDVFPYSFAKVNTLCRLYTIY